MTHVSSPLILSPFHLSVHQMPRPPAMYKYTVDEYLHPSHLSACFVLRPICTQGRAACELPSCQGRSRNAACPDAATLCTMRTLQIRETVTILKVDFPVDSRIRPFMSPTRKRDPASLSSNRRRPLDTPTSPRDQTSGFLMRCKTGGFTQ